MRTAGEVQPALDRLTPAIAHPGQQRRSQARAQQVEQLTGRTASAAFLGELAAQLAPLDRRGAAQQHEPADRHAAAARTRQACQRRVDHRSILVVCLIATHPSAYRIAATTRAAIPTGSVVICESVRELIALSTNSEPTPSSGTMYDV